ncbi:MAG TPA: hypothetical protein VK037_06475 [Pseudogracilibacillus sp.]|nr:hypothetical protein [Pseudogracilibacillus sp.]
MERIQPLYKTTKQLLEVVEKPYETFEEREKLIDEMNKLLVQREELMQEVKPPYTEEEETLGKQIIKMDETIKEKMNELFRSVQTDLRQLKQKRDSDKTYINPYKNLETVDGMYVDDKL